MLVFFYEHCLLWFVGTCIIKYLSIFYPSVFADSDYTDREILVKSRFFITALVLILIILDYGLIIDLEYMVLYQRMIGNYDESVENRNLPFLWQILTLISVCVFIWIQFHIEKSGFIDENMSKNRLRFIMLIIFITLAFAALPFSNKDFLLLGVLSLLPGFFVVSTPNLFDYFKSKFLKQYKNCVISS